jgi:DNA polymerase III alpha subunit
MILLAKNELGYRNLLALTTASPAEARRLDGDPAVR